MANQDVSIRQMTKEDIDKVYDIERRSFSYPFSKGIVYTMFLAYPDMCFVIQVNSEIVGFLLGELDVSDKQPHILSFAINEQYKRQGLGSKLLQFFIDYCKKANYKHISLEVRKDNDPAISLYKKFGFQGVKIIRKYYEDNMDAILMLKMLDE